MDNRRRIPIAFSIALSAFLGACAPEPSLGDPYAENDYFWPYEQPEPVAGDPDSEDPLAACLDNATGPLGQLADGTTITRLNTCDPSPEGDFAICARISP